LTCAGEGSPSRPSAGEPNRAVSMNKLHNRRPEGRRL
jgi:hypothetical protein